jgi:RecA-family ATPase
MENNHPTPYQELLNEDTKVHIPIEVFIEEIDKEIEIISDINNSNYFIIKTANEWIEEAKNRPTPKMIFDEFWYEGEVSILFADTNLGKSILAVQIGNSISKGLPIRGFESETTKQKVLYFDFELTDKQFQNRYSINFENSYSFDDDFLRVQINAETTSNSSLSEEEMIIKSLEESIIDTNSKIIIIDNLTYLKNETEKARNASPLMKLLRALKNKYDLSILILAHTPKRDQSKPLSKNDLQGSKMLINFCDGCFAIGESQKDSKLRYLKQIKVRQSEFKFDNNNVALCQIDKPSNFLGFEFLDFSSEREHLKEITDRDINQRNSQILELHSQGLANTKIAEIVGLTEGGVRGILKKIKN